MKDEDIARLSKGIQLKKKIASLNAQIENIQHVNVIKLFQTQKWDGSHKGVNFDIPLDDNHPYSAKAREFFQSYVEFLKERVLEVQNEFDSL
jgi:hypothetical protein